MKDFELKPCPFCGGKAYTAMKVVKGITSYEICFEVGCINCIFSLQDASEYSPISFDEAQKVSQKVISAWNKRTDGKLFKEFADKV